MKITRLSADDQRKLNVHKLAVYSKFYPGGYINTLATTCIEPLRKLCSRINKAHINIGQFLVRSYLDALHGVIFMHTHGFMVGAPVLAYDIDSSGKIDPRSTDVCVGYFVTKKFGAFPCIGFSADNVLSSGVPAVYLLGYMTGSKFNVSFFSYKDIEYLKYIDNRSTVQHFTGVLTATGNYGSIPDAHYCCPKGLNYLWPKPAFILPEIKEKVDAAVGLGGSYEQESNDIPDLLCPITKTMD